MKAVCPRTKGQTSFLGGDSKGDPLGEDANPDVEVPLGGCALCWKGAKHPVEKVGKHELTPLPLRLLGDLFTGLSRGSHTG